MDPHPSMCTDLDTEYIWSPINSMSSSPIAGRFLANVGVWQPAKDAGGLAVPAAEQAALDDQGTSASRGAGTPLGMP